VAETGQTSSFNRAADNVRDWLYQKRHGKHDARRDDMLARVATFPGGAELLQKAKDASCDIFVKSRRDTGAEGRFSGEGERPWIMIANTGNPAEMATSLWHELRHMLQHLANAPIGVAHAGQIKDPRTGYLMELMGEADAFTAETLVACQQKKSGNPEYYGNLLTRPSDGVYGYIARYLKKNPYESFKDDATFARAMFTYLMLAGPLNYRARYFQRLGNIFSGSGDAKTFNAALAASKSGGSAFSPELTEMYGSGYAGVSYRALAAAFSRGQPFDEQLTLLRIESVVRKAPHMTEQQFQEAKTDVLQHVKDVYFKESDNSFRGFDQDRAAQRLRHAALSDTPATFTDLKPPPAPPKPAAKDYSWMRKPQR
jgi:hypothetical protein